MCCEEKGTKNKALPFLGNCRQREEKTLMQAHCYLLLLHLLFVGIRQHAKTSIFANMYPTVQKLCRNSFFFNFLAEKAEFGRV